ncbi:hypothetical protein TRICI_002489 [Trichomonascus ciferrii]|uniref:Cyclin N-terminal domain-containing protein n=1 Tax=Trichomonascus ciferrii TaxID=44093 RepID=A0A642V6H7_9ASCO|nr:hypothetical protein TRICI_002489 [Trichomonascus ciferrii]
MLAAINTNNNHANSTIVYKDNRGSVLRLEESKAMFVEALVESAIVIIVTIWPHANKGGIPLKKFIKESLKRSRTCYSTFQVALYYLILLKESKALQQQETADEKTSGLKCGRRAFLSSLMIASKYLQDRNYTVKAWSTIVGLPVSDLRKYEMEFLKAVDWKVHVQQSVYNRWSSLLLSSATEDGVVWTEKIKCLGTECIIDTPTTPSDHWKTSNNDNIYLRTNTTTITNATTTTNNTRVDSGASAYPTPTMSDHDSDWERDEDESYRCNRKRKISVSDDSQTKRVRL